MRELILKSANQLFVEKGFEKTSIRNIADEIEYSPATIYLYFKDKNEIFLELHDRAFGEFLNEFSKVLDIHDPFERLMVLGRRYIDFAMEHPEYYDLMFIMRQPMEAQDENQGWAQGLQSYGILYQSVEECLAQGTLAGENAHAIALGLWSIVHGMVSLAIRSRTKMYDGMDLRKLMYEAHDHFMLELKQS